MKKLTLEQFNERLKKAHPNEHLLAIKYDGGRKNAEVVCLRCKTHYIKMGEYFTDARKVSVCKNCFPTRKNQLNENFDMPQGYTMLGKYTGMNNKVLVKHDCGFIWEITPNNLKLGKGCPKCNRKKSKGEQRIEKWLTENNINFIEQYKININEHHLSIDFYLFDLDLYIEYNGEQHYKPIQHFGGEKKFEQQIALDKLKKDYLKEKLLIISYLDFDNIESILESSTTSQ